MTGTQKFVLGLVSTGFNLTLEILQVLCSTHGLRVKIGVTGHIYMEEIAGFPSNIFHQFTRVMQLAIV